MYDIVFQARGTSYDPTTETLYGVGLAGYSFLTVWDIKTGHARNYSLVPELAVICSAWNPKDGNLYALAQQYWQEGNGTIIVIDVNTAVWKNVTQTSYIPVSNLALDEEVQV